jgi:hypothetical protein
MFLGSRARRVRRDDNLTSICNPIIQKIWDPWWPTTIWAYTASCRDNLIFLFSFTRSQKTLCRNNYVNLTWKRGARCSVVVKALCYRPQGRGFETGCDNFFNFPNSFGRTSPSDFYTTTDRNEYQKHKNNHVSGEKKRGRCVALTTLPPSVIQLSRQCGILNISQYGDSFTLRRRSVFPVRYELDCKYCYK